MLFKLKKLFDINLTITMLFIDLIPWIHSRIQAVNDLIQYTGTKHIVFDVITVRSSQTVIEAS